MTPGDEAGVLLRAFGAITWLVQNDVADDRMRSRIRDHIVFLVALDGAGALPISMNNPERFVGIMDWLTFSPARV